jgi:hypothetical protein
MHHAQQRGVDDISVVAILRGPDLFRTCVMSGVGTSRHFVAMQRFSRFLSEADIQRAAIAEPDL